MAATTASCIEIDTIDQLRSYETAWRELFAHSAQPSVFASWEWLYCWWRYFGGSSSSKHPSSRSPLLLIQVHDANNELVAMVPVYYAFQSGGRTRIPVLRMVGDLESGGENPTEEPVVLLKRGCERDAVAAVHAFLRHYPGRMDWSYASLALPYVDESSFSARAMSAAERRASSLLSLQRVSTAEILDLPESWDAFRQSLSKSLRDNLKYYPRLIGRHGYEYKIRVARTPAEVCAAAGTLTILHRLRNIGTQDNPRADHLPDAAHRAFLTDCLSSLAARGMATIYTLEINGKAVAAQSVLEGPEGLCIYYSGFDPEWHKYSPLTILAAEILKSAVERGVSHVNLLGASQPWKVRWGAKAVDRYARIVRIRWHLPSLLRCAAFHYSTTCSSRFAVAQAKPQLEASIRESTTG